MTRFVFAFWREDNELRHALIAANNKQEAEDVLVSDLEAVRYRFVLQLDGDEVLAPIGTTCIKGQCWNVW